MADQYSVVKGTSTTPPAVPGKTVRYSVRADATGSAWSSEVSISYPAVQVTPTPPEPGAGPGVLRRRASNLLAAPALTASGTTLAWNQVGTVTTYVLVRRIAGDGRPVHRRERHDDHAGAVAGKTARYSVRTAIDGSAWSPAVSIAYPADARSRSRPAPPSPAPARRSAATSRWASWPARLHLRAPLPEAAGARTARIEFAHRHAGVAAWRRDRRGVREGRRPAAAAGDLLRPHAVHAEAQSLASWAAAYGPGGTFWQGKSYPTSAGVTEIEFGNETSYSYQFSDNSLSTYAARAQTYAQRAKEAAVAIARREPERRPAGDRRQRRQPVGAWMVNMLKAVPDLADLRQRLDDPPVRPHLGGADRLDDQLGEEPPARATCRSGSPSGASRPTTAAACRTTTASTSA